jgi:transcriptional regulator with XRE-family HTH domain
MRVSEELAKVARQIVGNQSPRDFADAVGTSHSTIYDLLKGRQNVSRKMLAQIADRAGISGPLRIQLLGSAGFTEETADALSASAQKIARVVEGLPEEDQITIWRLLSEPKLLTAARMFLDASVIRGAAGQREALAAASG